MVEDEGVAKRPVARFGATVGQVGKGTASAARGTGRFIGGTGKALWGPIIGILLIAAGLGLGIGATSFFMEFYESDDQERSRSEYMDQVQEDVQPFWWMGVLLILVGAAVIAIDIYGKHVRDGMLGRR